jgi:hypothetical protein
MWKWKPYAIPWYEGRVILISGYENLSEPGVSVNRNIMWLSAFLMAKYPTSSP